MSATYPIPFDPNDGTEDIVIQVSAITEGFARGADGDCAFCEGDPCAERADSPERIKKYIALNMGQSGPLACPCCDGRPP